MSAIDLFSKTALGWIHRILDISAARQNAHAKNLANLSTPGYRPVTAVFADELESADRRTLALRVTHPAHATSGTPEGNAIDIVPDDGPGGTDRVDIDKEMVSLAESQLEFSLAARLAAIRMAGIRASIRGRS